MLKTKHIKLIQDYADQLRNKEVECSKPLAESGSVLLYAIDHMDDQPQLTNWLSGRQEYPHFYSQIVYDLSEIIPQKKISKHPPLDDYRILLDHHYWNDVDPTWSYTKGRSGYYGQTPGEDVVIKLIGTYIFNYK